MIRFSCIYCGKLIVAEDAKATKLGKCPACSHIVRVPRKRAGGDPEGRSAMARRLNRMSDQEVADTLLADRPGEDGTAKIARWVAEPFLPKYDDLTLFTLSAALLLLLLIYHYSPTELERKLNVEWIDKIGSRALGNLIILIGIAGIGMVASFFGVFFKRDKGEFLKFAMLCFAVLVTSATGIYAGYIAIKTSQSWLMMIFPAWNIINGVILLLLFRSDLMDIDCITDEHANLWQVILTMVCISIIMAICHFGFHLHWTITYSICVCYTMTLNQTLTDLLGKHTVP
jgi:DNA-directed RNA polymerase subunit RPC12/RpoP